MSAAGPWVIERSSTDYPVCLTDLDRPEQPLLYGAGRRDAIAGLARDPVVTIVGARQASGYGLRVAERLGRDLAVAGVTVVSGMARGIDAAAHRGALLGGGATIAVLAGGPDKVYPPMNRALYREILGVGAVISEHPPGTEARKHQFPARNRIMAALSRLTVVVEAADPSGSLITTDFARDLGRSVAAVPGRVTSKVARGTNGLLKDGAVPITSTEDVLDELFGVDVRRLPDKVRPAPTPEDPVLRAVLDAAEQSSSIDAIAATTGTSAAQVRAALGRLEVDGHLVRRALGGWERRA